MTGFPAIYASRKTQAVETFVLVYLSLIEEYSVIGVGQTDMGVKSVFPSPGAALLRFTRGGGQGQPVAVEEPGTAEAGGAPGVRAVWGAGR